MGLFLGTYCLDVLLCEFLCLDIPSFVNLASVETKEILLCVCVSKMQQRVGYNAQSGFSYLKSKGTKFYILT